MTNEAAAPAVDPIEAAAPAAKPAPVFDAEAARFEVVPLDWPVTIDGVRYEQITVRRMTVGQIADFLEAMSKSEGSRLRFPMYDVSDEVLEALDADDGDKVEEATKRFLPRRFRVAETT